MEWQSTPVFLPGESLGQRNPMGYNLWVFKESDIRGQLTLTYNFRYISKKFKKSMKYWISLGKKTVYYLYVLIRAIKKNLMDTFI